VLSRGRRRRSVRSPYYKGPGPLIKAGAGYRVSPGCPAAGFSVAAALAWVPLPPALCLGTGYFIKCPCPLDQHIRGICPRLASDSFVERGFAWCGWWRPCVAGVTPVSSLCRSCRAPAGFNKARVKGFVVFAGLGLQWRRSRPAAGAAGSSVEAGLLGRMS
jgi:hypothetical protein